jgi:hypothetical protein
LPIGTAVGLPIAECPRNGICSTQGNAASMYSLGLHISASKVIIDRQVLAVNSMEAISLPEQEAIGYLAKYCSQIQSLDSAIRFAGIADYAGKLSSSFYRPGLVPLMDRQETEQYAIQTVFRARTRGGFKPQLGEQRYALAAYDNLVRATLTITNPVAEHHNMYLLVSLDVRAQYPAVLEKIIRYIGESKNELFVHTRAISEKYLD